MKRIIVASDSWKGSLTSREAGEAISEGIRDVCPDFLVSVWPISDGGEGMSECFAAASGGRMVDAGVHDALLRPLSSHYGLSGDGKTAYIGVADSAGLTLLTPEERNPLLTTTVGMGEMMRLALDRGASHLVMGLGGSSTNDGGTGMATALGYRFLDREGREVKPCGQSLADIESIDRAGADPRLRATEMVVACDVRSPFCGPAGAVCTFAAQKGASSRDIRFLDEGMAHLAEVIRRTTGHDVTREAGAGAAGGLGGMLSALFGARMKSGISLLLEVPAMRRALAEADFIVTGEGRMDRQTAMGKAAWGILHEGLRRGKPVIALAGQVENAEAARAAGFLDAVAVTPPGQPLAEAMRPEVARNNARQTAAHVFRDIASSLC